MTEQELKALESSYKDSRQLNIQFQNRIAELEAALSLIASFDDGFKASSEYDKGLGAAYAALASVARKALK